MSAKSKQTDRMPVVETAKHTPGTSIQDVRSLHGDLLYLASLAQRDLKRSAGNAEMWTVHNERSIIYRDLALRLESQSPTLAAIGNAWREKIAKERAEAKAEQGAQS